MSRILGIDYGTKNIGLALCVSELSIPHSVIDYRPNHPLEAESISRISKIIEEENIDIVVFGLPLLNGKETKSSKQVKRYSELLRKRVPDNVVFEYIDEFKTSKLSLKKSILAGISRKGRKNDHEIAACEIINRREHYK